MSGVMAQIAGAYEHPARTIPDKTLEQVHLEIAAGALVDAGLGPSDWTACSPRRRPADRCPSWRTSPACHPRTCTSACG
jgi:hypothetical protein